MTLMKKIITPTLIAPFIGAIPYTIIMIAPILFEVSSDLKAIWNSLLGSYMAAVVIAELLGVIIFYPLCKFYNTHHYSHVKFIIAALSVWFVLSFVAALFILILPAALEFGARYTFSLGLPTILSFMYINAKRNHT